MVFEQVRDIVAGSMGRRLRIDAAQITMETRFKNDLHADSLDVANIITSLEEEFDLLIDDNEADKILTVGDAVDYIEKNVT